MNIVLDSNAQRQLKRTPKNIIKKLRDWVVNVMQLGLREVARRPGYHDEPLSGKRSGQRSIRLSKQWRAIYQPFPARIAIETVTPHDYRVKGAAEVDALPFLNQLLGEPMEAEVAGKAQQREIVATLIKAGRRDLARQFVGAAEKPPTTEREGWTGGAKIDRFRHDSASIDRYVRAKDGAVIDWMHKFHGGSGQMSDFVRVWQTGSRSWSQSNMLFGQRGVLTWLKQLGRGWDPFAKAWQKTHTVEIR